MNSLGRCSSCDFLSTERPIAHTKTIRELAVRDKMFRRDSDQRMEQKILAC